jgi:hypothetical protein
MHVGVTLQITSADAQQAVELADRVDGFCKRLFLEAEAVFRRTELCYGDRGRACFTVTAEGLELLMKVTRLDTMARVAALAQSSVRSEAQYLHQRLVLHGMIAAGDWDVSVEIESPVLPATLASSGGRA